ncbi:MAG: DEAD/DEAH box helicase [Verrucomicrobiales bacterium]|nr:DEAD/DEAH box helicase [Verrucomicrobiales bacterium]
MTSELRVTPSLQLRFALDEESSDRWLKLVARGFGTSRAAGLFALGATDPTEAISPVLHYWRDFSRSYLTELCRTPETELQVPTIEPLPATEFSSLLLSAPPMEGGEYLSVEGLEMLWEDLDQWVRGEIGTSGLALGPWLEKHAKAWHQVGRVCFHLAENKKDPEYPFAFLATFSPQLSKSGKVQYKPLGQALKDYAGAKNKKALTQLLSPVQRAADQAEFIAEMVDSGDVFHPLAWTPPEAYQLLRHAPLLEEAGLLLRLPNWWKKRSRPRVSVSIGNKKESQFGADQMMDFKIDLALGEEKLTEAEWKQIMNSDDGLAFIKGQWIEVDKEKLSQVLDQWKQVEAEAEEGGISFIEGMRLLAGAPADLTSDDSDEVDREWAQIKAGDWLSEILNDLRSPENLMKDGKVEGFQGTLRPYQEVGYQWLRLLSSLGLGACLADDMGLGKTVQVISFLLSIKQTKGKKQPSLLVLPASLLSNWKSEIERFAPSLTTAFVHPSLNDRVTLSALEANLAKTKSPPDVVLTTYGMLNRQKWLSEIDWNVVILDEAQAIKNPGTRQTKAVKALKARSRIALTGTPVENRLSDLWSLFDFVTPGLLGNASKFKTFSKMLEARHTDQYAPLRNLVSPYILRRLKTDKSIISDLPDKTEMNAFCGLTKQQAALYTKAVKSLRSALENSDGIKRRGVVLASLTAFKQICNHPSQFLGDGEYDPKHSGKFARLTALCEEIASRQEKVLVFTQYREMTGPIAAALTEIFGREGHILHGGTAVKKRQQLVKDFQSDEGPPFFVLSLKAGGTGLTLTAASHVIHFDRWWNPAVENQATDRAFRIGQKRNVMVHKFVCQGTMEEKVDKLLDDKSTLADDLLKGGGESMLTEMTDDELLEVVTLNVDKATF